MTDLRLLQDELLDLASAAASAAVELIHTRRPQDLTVGAKSTATDLVTQMDTASEALIRSMIATRRPGDHVVGEEGGATTADPAYDGAATGVTWWIDPIDGTTNYVYDHPGYNVSIAAGDEHGALVAVVADPTHARTYTAVRGAGAWCDDQRLGLASPPTLQHALVATGFAYRPELRARQGLVVAGLLPQVRDIRRMGAAALDLCSVAAGRVDAYYEAGLQVWDLAAGSLVASEAGARVGALDGGPASAGSVLVAHPDLFEPLRALLVDLGADDLERGVDLPGPSDGGQ